VSTSRAAKRQPELTTAGGSAAVPDSLNKPAAEQSAAGFVLFGTACKLQLDFTPMQTLPYLPHRQRVDRRPVARHLVRDFAGPALTSSDAKWLPGVAITGAAAPAAPSD